MGYVIRDLKQYGEMITACQLQRKIWGLDADIGLYPPILNTASRNGGIVLGAFDEETDQMIAFLFSFLGREPNGLFKLCSQTMGVEKAWRGYGIAEELKQMQRKKTIDQGLKLMTWTYDPLEAPNAHLNLRKLRAVTRTYWRDVYGSNFGALNQGLPSDRFVVEWWVSGEHLEDDPEVDWDIIDEAVPVFETRGTGIARQVVQANLALDADNLLVEIPSDIHPLKAANMDLAFDWRMKIRKIFETYFAKGYITTDFVSTRNRSGERQNRYLLQRATPELTANIGIVS
ncbi:MAG: hypothetical protein AAF485_17800 [Chloroflexota bacterium]